MGTWNGPKGVRIRKVPLYRMLYSCTATAPSATGTSMTNREFRQSCWKALEYLFNNGKARAKGVSNFEVNHIQDIVDLKGLLPAVNQVEYHPFWHEDDLVEYCQKMGITFNRYAPLGASDWGAIERGWDCCVLNDPTVDVQWMWPIWRRTLTSSMYSWQQQTCKPSLPLNRPKIPKCVLILTIPWVNPLTCCSVYFN